MSDSVKKYYEMIEDGEITSIKKHTVLTDDIAIKEWEKYWEFNEDILSNSEDFEVAYGFVNWLKNKKLI